METTISDTPVNTRSVRNRRKVAFASVDQMLADANCIAQADRMGTLVRLGNWTAGQAFGHVAAWMDYPYDGYPMNPPWFVKVIGRVIKPLVLSRGIPAGGRLPGVAGGTYAVDVVPLEQALAHLHTASERLRTTDPKRSNPVFGSMSHAQWILLNLHHAELHFGFFVPPTS
jgi:hypothetical protein